MNVPMKDVPKEVRRVASQHLESMRGTEIMRGLDAARVGGHAVPIYRPDIEGIAYWEFSVFAADGRGQVLKTRGYESKEPCGPSGQNTNDSSAQPVGFIVATNGRHDFPIAHWSLDRLPPSLQVERDATEHCGEDAQSQRGAVKRLYRLDALSYVAEDESGEIVGQSGQIPAPIRGLPHNLARYAGQVVSSIARVMHSEKTDENAARAQYERERAKFESPTLTRSADGGWKALKEEYADAFGPLLEQLRMRAAKTWEMEDAIRQFGEGILTGTTHRAALLGEACVELVGDGARLVRASMEENGAPALILTAAAVSLPQEASFDAVIVYADGERERLPFFVVSRDVPSNTKAERERNGSTDCED